MKKCLAVLLMLAFILSSCTSQKTEEERGLATEASDDAEYDTSEEEKDGGLASDAEDLVAGGIQRNENSFELGETIVLKGSELTVTNLEIINDLDGRKNLKVIYTWTNTTDQTMSSSYAHYFLGFQNGVETEHSSSFDSEVMNLNQMREVRPGGTIEQVEIAIGIDDMSLPMELEIRNNVFADSDSYIMLVEDLNSL